MSKISRKRLARGTRLAVEHQSSATTPARDLVNNAAFDRDNLVQNRGVCRVNLTVPALRGEFFTYAKQPGEGVDFVIPFTLPPLQEFFDTSGVPSADTPAIVLDEFTLSFDQSAEAAAIVNGLIDYLASTRLNISVSLVEKPQRRFPSLADTTAGYTPEREVFSALIPAAAFAGNSFRANPFILTNMGKALSPYKTYGLMIACPDLYAPAGQSIDLPSLCCSLKLTHPLVQRDDGNTQNMPNGLNSQVAPTITVPVPTVNSVISADSAAGPQTVLNTLDQTFLSKLDGGLTWDSNKPPFEAVQTESTYDIIMVPMWQNCVQSYRGWTATTMVHNPTGVKTETVIPYIDTDGPFAGTTCHRQFVPLTHPFVLHHAIAIANYSSPGGPGARGTPPQYSQTLTTSVGVGINTGLRADFMACENVAWVEWLPSTKDAITIDQYKARPNGTLTSAAYDFELFSIPLVGTGGTGYFPQGRPVFCGMSNSNGAPRTPLNGAGATTLGLEQFLEIRWAMSAPDGFSDVPFSTSPDPDTVYAGFGGHWVQLIGKKSATVAAGDIPR